MPNGIPYFAYSWPEFAWVDWPLYRTKPKPLDVCRLAYEMAGLDFSKIEHQQFVRSSGKRHERTILYLAAIPILIRVCHCTAAEACTLLRVTRLTRNHHVMRTLKSPAARLLTDEMSAALLRRGLVHDVAAASPPPQAREGVHAR